MTVKDMGIAFCESISTFLAYGVYFHAIEQIFFFFTYLLFKIHFLFINIIYYLIILFKYYFFFFFLKYFFTRSFKNFLNFFFIVSLLFNFLSQKNIWLINGDCLDNEPLFIRKKKKPFSTLNRLGLAF